MREQFGILRQRPPIASMVMLERELGTRSPLSVTCRIIFGLLLRRKCCLFLDSLGLPEPAYCSAWSSVMPAFFWRDSGQVHPLLRDAAQPLSGRSWRPIGIFPPVLISSRLSVGIETSELKRTTLRAIGRSVLWAVRLVRVHI